MAEGTKVLATILLKISPEILEAYQELETASADAAEESVTSAQILAAVLRADPATASILARHGITREAIEAFARNDAA